jgi:hypothetical protein
MISVRQIRTEGKACKQGLKKIFVSDLNDLKGRPRFKETYGI